MWEEKNTSTGKVNTKVMTIDSNGKTVISEKTMPIRLSDCQPIFCSDNLVKWYVTDGKIATLYSINPYDIDNFHYHKYVSKVTKERKVIYYKDETNDDFAQLGIKRKPLGEKFEYVHKNII